MPGPWVKDWKTYEALKEKGYSKGKSARIANAQATKKKNKKLRFKGKIARKQLRFSRAAAGSDSDYA